MVAQLAAFGLAFGISPLHIAQLLRLLLLFFLFLFLFLQLFLLGPHPPGCGSQFVLATAVFSLMNVLLLDLVSVALPSAPEASARWRESLRPGSLGVVLSAGWSLQAPLPSTSLVAVASRMR